MTVLQSNYIPWKGYFDLIHDADLFIFYDDVQYTKNDWRNRNRIKTRDGTLWLTVPVGDRLNRLVCETEIHDARWSAKHWKSLQQWYAKAPFFDLYRDFLADVYTARQWRNLSELNQYVIVRIARDFLGIAAEFADSRSYQTAGQREERLLALLTEVGARTYVSGPTARAYINEEHFAARGIRVIYKDYNGYPEYPQFHPPFEHAVSILDLLFHTGPRAPEYIWGWRDAARRA